jgi:cation diffusion facilitator CzcD-associated flavoprotein CzcO
VYKTWTWTEEYPGSEEQRRYFTHVDKQLDLKKDVLLDTKVLAVEFNILDNKWTIHCDSGTTIRASFFIPAIGFAALSGREGLRYLQRRYSPFLVLAKRRR